MDLLSRELKRVLTARIKGRRYVALLLCLSLLVGLGTVSALTKPGAALTHQKRVLSCAYEAPSGEGYAGYCAHTHNADCYDENGRLVCPLEEHEAHYHTDACWETVSELTCGLEENDGHVHTDACYARAAEPSCGLEECEGHTHGHDCYSWDRVLVCPLEESEGHTHSEACCGEDGELICGLEESEGHTHGDACYEEVRGELICGLEESEGHTHTEACYPLTDERICGKEEGEGAHHHNESCYHTYKKNVCGIEGIHIHSADCYDAEGNLVCGQKQLEAHVHGDECFKTVELSPEEVDVLNKEFDDYDVTEEDYTWTSAGDPNADAESWSDWENMFADVAFSGNWAKDVLTVAQTQLGYAESASNYALSEKNEVKGYTRYGDWYGIPYGDWCAMFASFCIRWAGVPEEAMPIDCSCRNWVSTLGDRGMFAAAGSYVPKAGDLVFYDFNFDGISDHVGLVSGADAGSNTLTTIEGNRINSVARFCFELSDTSIMGYGLLPENPAPPEPEAEMPEQDFEDSIGGLNVTVHAPAGAFPAHTEMRLRAVSSENVMDAVNAAVKTEITSVQAVDISFYDENGTEIEPLIPIRVSIRSEELGGDSDSVLLHVTDEGEAEVVKKNQASDSVDFSSDEFSVYILVGTTIEETVLASDGHNYKVSVTYGPETGLPNPEVVDLAVTEITEGSMLYGMRYEDYVASTENALNLEQGSADYVRLFDIKIVNKYDHNIYYQPAPGSVVDVKIELDDVNRGELNVVHFADGSGTGDVVQNVAVNGNSLSFGTDGFSVYAVIGGTDPTARMMVSFHVISYDESNQAVDTLRASVYVKNKDSADELPVIVYDPGVGALAEGETFRGWTFNPDYTVDEATTDFNGDFAHPYGAMSIEDVRDWVQYMQDPEGGGPIDETNGMQSYHLYAMILKNFTVSYLDRFGISLDTDSAYMLRNETQAAYTVNKTYNTNDEDYHFKGWITDDETPIHNPDPAPETVTVRVPSESDPEVFENRSYSLYTNNTQITLTGDVTFKAHAPKGKWLVFHEVEKGATYIAPQFLEEGEAASMPDPADMHLLGYDFAGWYTTTNYEEGTEFTGGTINVKTDLYAKWVPSTWAPYTVIIWKEGLNGEYAYQESVKLYGPVGSTVESVNSLQIVDNNDADYLRISGQDQNHNAVNRTFQTVHSTTGASPNIVHHYYYAGTTTDSDYVGFNCSSIDYTEKDDNGNSVPVVIDAAGTKVVNVYYDRIEYSVKLYLLRRRANGTYYHATYRSNGGANRPELEISNGGNGMDWGHQFTYNSADFPSNMDWEQRGDERYSYVEVKAKYGTDIASQWPKYADLKDLGNYKFTSWYTMNAAGFYQGAGSGLDSFKGIITIMDEYILGDITRANGANYLIGRYDQNIAEYTYEIWKECVSGQDYSSFETATKGDKTYYHDTEEDIYSRSSAKPSGAHAPSYRGFKYRDDLDVRPPDPAGNGQYGQHYTIEFYYDRVANPIVFRDGSYFDGNGNRLNDYPNRSADVESDPILFEDDVSSYNKGGDDYNDTYPPAYPGFVLEGWYTDDACTTPYTFATMPDTSITVYAKWRQVQYRVFLHPQVPEDKTVYWGSDSQAMNFRISWGGKVSLPEGKLVDPNDNQILDESYEFAGWYRDPEYHLPYDGDAFVLNDDITVPYDKTTDLTDDMNDYGEITGGGPDGHGWNSDSIYYDQNSGQWITRDRWWITKKLDLYGKWIKKMDEGDGIQIRYHLNGGTMTDIENFTSLTEDGNVIVVDTAKYKDQTNAAAFTAPDVPPTYTPEGSDTPVSKVFLYWVLQKWDPAGGENGQGAYVDLSPLEFVYPGDTFLVEFNNARTVTVPVLDPITGEPATDPEGHPVTKEEYYLQLRAEYTDPENETPTHIWWYSNYGELEVIRTNEVPDPTNPPDGTITKSSIGINEAVNIKAPDTFAPPTGYRFLGWARVDAVDDQGQPIAPALHPELGENDLFLKYVEASGSVAAHYEAQNNNGEWVPVTQVAADEENPYHDLYAVWDPIPYTLTVVKTLPDRSSEADKDSQYFFTVSGLTDEDTSFALYGREKKTGETVTQANSTSFTVPYGTAFSITETEATDFSTVITVTYADGTETEITGKETGSLTMNGDLTVTYTNTRSTQFVSIWKTSQTNVPLTGASFKLYKVTQDEYDAGAPGSETEPVLSGTVDADTSILDLGELETGYYLLVETQAPNGYHLLSTPVQIIVDASGVTALQGGNPAAISQMGDENWVDGQNVATWQIQVWNTAGVELPHTGGAGTSLFTLIGALLTGGAAWGLISGRRLRRHRKVGEARA